MKEILPHIYHWKTFHEGIQSVVHSYYVENKRAAFLIDPRIPKQGLTWFQEHQKPRHIYLTNRLHYRHSDDFVNAFHCDVWCHRAGLAYLKKKKTIQAFDHNQRLPGGVIAINVSILCPEESVLFIPLEGGILSIADAIIRVAGKLTFVPDELLGDKPDLIKKGIKAEFRKLLRRKFKHLFFAHGQPVLENGKEALLEFLER